MKLDFSLPAIHLSALENSKVVEASSPALGNTQLEGKVVSIDSRINPVDRSIKVRAEVPNKDNRIKHGMLMHVNLLLSNRDGLTIPETSIVQMRDEHFVYKVVGGEDLRAQLQPVEIGIRQPGKVEIIAGLVEGDRVVTRGASMLSPNRKIRVVNSEG
jgi:membrane fusion protein (multidrug efflux system)